MYEVDVMTGKRVWKFLYLVLKNLIIVLLTSDTRDYGADFDQYIDGIKIVVQAKRQERPVGINAVQEVVSAIKHHTDKGNGNYK